MGSSSNFRDGIVHTHQLGESGMSYSTCTVCVGERAKPPRVGEWDATKGEKERRPSGDRLMAAAADVLLSLLNCLDCLDCLD